MRKILYFLIILAVTCNSLPAQKKLTVKVESATSYEKILPPDMLYEFAEFKPGRLYYKDGSVVNNHFNYSLIGNAFLFKNSAGTQMELTNPQQLSMFLIDSCFWIPIRDGFGKIIYHKDNLDLIKYRTTKCTNIKQEGAFGTTTNSASITNITSFQGSGNAQTQLSVLGEYDFEVQVTYFIKTDDNTLEQADARGFKKLFPQSKDLITQEIKKEKLNLSKEEDILKLIHTLPLRTTYK